MTRTPAPAHLVRLGISSAGDELRHCSGCSGEQVFTAVPCSDGHEDCPERVCVGCGTAVLVLRWAG